MKLSQNAHQRLMLVLFLGLDVYRILIGSFYSIFVPQICPDFKHVPANTTMTYHTCTLEDNVTDLTVYNKAVIGLNAVTALLMAYAFIEEVRREEWMIKHLDVDAKKADDNLVTEIVPYTKMKGTLLRKNRQYRNVFYAVAAMNTLNVITSAVLVAEYFDGLKTVTTFLTNGLLIVLRIYKSIQISRTCEKEMKAQSVFLAEQTTFNTIDAAYRKEEESPTA
jgi:hypothetical protein